MRDAFKAALEAGFGEARLDIRADGGFTITAKAGDGPDATKDDWTEAIHNAA